MALKILITGAAGDIGTRLTKQLDILTESKEIDLYTTALTELSYESNSTHGVFDIRQIEFLDWVSEIKPDVIIHLASIIKLPDGMTEQEAFDIDVKATESLLKCAVNNSVKKFAVTSSGAAYGYWPDNPEWLTEEHPVRGNDDYFYSRHKKCVEKLLESYRKDYPQLKQVILRPGTVLGPNFENPITSMFEKPNIMGIAGASSPFVIIWVDDLVQYLVEAALSDVEGVFNVAGDGTLTLKDIAKRLNKRYIAVPSCIIKTALAILKPLRLSQYGPEQVKFIQFRPVLKNQKIKTVFKHQPLKTTSEAFDAFIEQSEKEYIQS